MMAPVQINYYRNSYCRLCCSNGNNKNGKENAVEFFRIQIFIEYNEIDIHTIQDQFNSHQHRYHVTPGE
jgi:hypothetical protein